MTVDLIFMLKQMYKLFEIGCDVLSLQATDLSCRQTRCQKEIDRKLGLLCRYPEMLCCLSWCLARRR